MWICFWDPPRGLATPCWPVAHGPLLRADKVRNFHAVLLTCPARAPFQTLCLVSFKVPQKRQLCLCSFEHVQRQAPDRNQDLTKHHRTCPCAIWLLLQTGVLFASVHIIRVLLFGVGIRTPDCWKVPCGETRKEFRTLVGAHSKGAHSKAPLVLPASSLHSAVESNKRV